MARAKTETVEEVTPTTNEVERFDGYAIIKSERYGQYEDILRCLLDDGELYSHEDIDKLLDAEFNRPIVETVNE